MKKIFINSDLKSEKKFYVRYSNMIEDVNKWLIPFMHKFDIEVNLNNINDCLSAISRDQLIDEIIARKYKNLLRPARMRRYIEESEKTLDKFLLEIIEQGARYKAHEDEYRSAKEKYRKDIENLSTELEKTFNEIKAAELKQKISSIASFEARLEANKPEELSYIIESEKREFQVFLKQKYDFFKVIDLVILENDYVRFDSKKVSEKFAVYAENEYEIKLYDKIKILQKQINDIYKNDFPGAHSAFYNFFSVSDGKVIINPEIKKDVLVKYSQNL